ncbi:MAG TPA: cytidine deaminase [Caldithrix abyssi]|uniref:Cytidine deaminase n=1 Tax=Caldithrix abyssi TaxID=187145 RepID=A0A7V5UFJ9_CALAY|nr:cytidine deaminase [Caldithrix abyssi]
MTNEQTNLLIDQAKKARQFSQSKYSNFKVGAALITTDDEVFTGCNVESSSYGLTICAERVALTKALSEGRTKFKAIAIVAKDGEYCPPCGACRQLLYDYAPDIDVILTNGQDKKVYKLKELLPHAFEDSQLE